MNKGNIMAVLLGLGISGCYGSNPSPGLIEATTVNSNRAEVANAPETALADTVTDEQVPNVAKDTDGDERQGSSAIVSSLPAIEPNMQSMQQVTRVLFAGAADDDPIAVEAMEFIQDAGHDDFADLLAH